MWIIFANVFGSAMLAGLFVAPLLAYGYSAVPLLARRNAHPIAYFIAAIPAVTALAVGVSYVSAVVLGWRTLDASVIVLILLSTFVLGGAAAALAARITSSRHASQSPFGTIGAELDAAEVAHQRLDLDAVLESLRRAARSRPEGAGDLVDAVREALPRAETGGLSTLDVVMPALRDREGRFWRSQTRVARGWIFVVTAISFTALAIPLGGTALANARACIDAEELLPSAAGADSGTGPPLADALPTDAEAGAILVTSQGVDLDEVAESRHDPDTARYLQEAGFLGGIVRGWEARDGRRIHAEVFEFRDPDGAQRFHAVANRYACGFANDAFPAPDGGIGLQVRWSTGDPIEEQVSWVSGSRRYLASIGHLAPPRNHARVLAIAARLDR